MKCEQTEKRAAEQRQVEEKKHTEEIQFLKRTTQQLKVNRIRELFCHKALILNLNIIGHSTTYYIIHINNKEKHKKSGRIELQAKTESNQTVNIFWYEMCEFSV